jgi:hypothetical protein
MLGKNCMYTMLHTCQAMHSKLSFSSLLLTPAWQQQLVQEFPTNSVSAERMLGDLWRAAASCA